MIGCRASIPTRGCDTTIPGHLSFYRPTRLRRLFLQPACVPAWTASAAPQTEGTPDRYEFFAYRPGRCGSQRARTRPCAAQSRSPGFWLAESSSPSAIRRSLSYPKQYRLFAARSRIVGLDPYRQTNPRGWTDIWADTAVRRVMRHSRLTTPNAQRTAILCLQASSSCIIPSGRGEPWLP